MVFHQLSYQRKTLDVISVGELLKSNDLEFFEKSGGWSWLSELAERIPTAANIGYYVNIVSEYSTLRSSIQTLQLSLSEAYETNVGEVEDYLSRTTQMLTDLQLEKATNHAQKISPLSVLKRLEESYMNRGQLQGLTTGLVDLDNLIGGGMPGELIILAGRPSMGKTSAGLGFALSGCKDSHLPIVIFSLEQSREQIDTRLLFSEARVNSKRMRDGLFKELDLQKIMNASQELEKIPLYVMDGSASLMEMRNQCRKIINQGNSKLGAIFIDYLGLIPRQDLEGDTKTDKIGEAARLCKALASDFRCPVYLLAQLNREVERRPDKRPMMSDLRDSGNIEEHADKIIFIYRDEVYNSNSEQKGVAEFIVAKNRDGAIGAVKAYFTNEYTRFDNFSMNRSNKEPFYQIDNLNA